MASQKLGSAKPTWLAAITATSARLLWRDAAYTPTASASTTVSAIAIAAKGRLTCKRSAMSVKVGVSYDKLAWLCPSSKPPTQRP